MSEELDIPTFLSRLDLGLSPIERVLLGHTGTVQLLLSLWFGAPVEVLVHAQKEDESRILRTVQLVTSDKPVAGAVSVIPLGENRPEILADIRVRQLGIGQIAVKHGIPTERKITKVEVTPKFIRRLYTIEGDGLLFAITETFERELYRSA